MVSERIGEGMAKATLRAILGEMPERHQPLRCRTCRLAETLSQDDRVALQEYLSSDMSTQIIAEALNAYGVKISQSAVSRHRRECPPID